MDLSAQRVFFCVAERAFQLHSALLLSLSLYVLRFLVSQDGYGIPLSTAQFNVNCLGEMVQGPVSNSQ